MSTLSRITLGRLVPEGAGSGPGETIYVQIGELIDASRTVVPMDVSPVTLLVDTTRVLFLQNVEQ